jgi:PIN domain nuclease of toxin-antitoxin system
MQYLLDTHSFLWFINGDDSLSSRVKKEIANIDNKCFLSIASLWEIAIKTSIGKLSLQSSFDHIATILLDNEIELLPISLSHLQTLLNLEYRHRDPFDRLIISQAISEDLTIITKDDLFSNYKVKISW